MKYYLAQDLTLTINDTQLQCQVSADLSEVMEAAQVVSSSQGWLVFAPNLQSYTISVSGIDDGGYLFLRELKRSREKVSWAMSTKDLEIDLGGTARITSVSKSTSTDIDENFSATLQGYGSLQADFSTSFLQNEDGTLRLLQNGDIRLLENA